MGAQRVINPDNIGVGSFELKGDKGVANPEGLIYLLGKRVRSTIYRLNLIKLYRRKPELANLVMENSAEGMDFETLYSMLINSLREDTEYLLDLGVNGMGQSIRTLPVVWLGRKTREKKRDERERSPALDGEKGEILPWMEKAGEESRGWNGREAIAVEKGLVRHWSGKTMNAGGVEK
ncbi:hypothetical protein TNCV_858271 [Trichonephila clavipes]|nr:hypothetical protein TNCV_858271 [Trichonephila clavipes]